MDFRVLRVSGRTRGVVGLSNRRVLVTVFVTVFVIVIIVVVEL